jgi:hypothetical protein
LSDPALERRAGGGAEPRLEADRRLDPHRGQPRRAGATLVDGFFPQVTVSERRSAARAARSPSSVCPMRRMRRSPATWPPSSAASSAPRLSSTALPHSPTAPASCIPTAVLFNGGVLKSALISAACARPPQRLAHRRRRPARAAARRRRPRPRGGTRRGLLRLRAPRARRAHPRRHRACLLRRRWSRDAGHPRHGAAARRRCASRPSAWKKAARPPCPRRSSAWWWASRCASASSARRCGARTRSAPCSISGPMTSCRSSKRSRPPCPPKAAARATSCA